MTNHLVHSTVATTPPATGTTIAADTGLGTTSDAVSAATIPTTDPNVAATAVIVEDDITRLDPLQDTGYEGIDRLRRKLWEKDVDYGHEADSSNCHLVTTNYYFDLNSLAIDDLEVPSIKGVGDNCRFSDPTKTNTTIISIPGIPLFDERALTKFERLLGGIELLHCPQVDGALWGKLSPVLRRFVNVGVTTLAGTTMPPPGDDDSTTSPTYKLADPTFVTTDDLRRDGLLTDGVVITTIGQAIRWVVLSSLLDGFESWDVNQGYYAVGTKLLDTDSDLSPVLTRRSSIALLHSVNRLITVYRSFFTTNLSVYAKDDSLTSREKDKITTGLWRFTTAWSRAYYRMEPYWQFVKLDGQEQAKHSFSLLFLGYRLLRLLGLSSIMRTNLDEMI
ncbi:hypothetical protein FOZ63_000679 [Perkinsus olseni]|uniref:Uncharacterized protein n=1 Tax=Perkinsus olseni TaxID=32597 RepID=A0A7J6N5I5_PEROL|nr:hypothetical protein FOZ63_000679 [Perkinsus olseni]